MGRQKFADSLGGGVGLGQVVGIVMPDMNHVGPDFEGRVNPRRLGPRMERFRIAEQGFDAADLNQKRREAGEIRKQR